MQRLNVPVRTLRTSSALAIFAVFVAAASSVWAEQISASDIKALRVAIAASKSGNWKLATTHASRTSAELPKKVVAWLRFKSAKSGAAAEDIIKFIDANPEWPSPRLMRQRAEEALTDSTSDQVVLDWFERYPPVSAAGAIGHLAALVRAERHDEAVLLARQDMDWP